MVVCACSTQIVLSMAVMDMQFQRMGAKLLPFRCNAGMDPLEICFLSLGELHELLLLIICVMGISTEFVHSLFACLFTGESITDPLFILHMFDLDWAFLDDDFGDALLVIFLKLGRYSGSATPHTIQGILLNPHYHLNPSVLLKSSGARGVVHSVFSALLLSRLVFHPMRKKESKRGKDAGCEEAKEERIHGLQN